LKIKKKSFLKALRRKLLPNLDLSGAGSVTIAADGADYFRSFPFQFSEMAVGAFHPFL
jgi:hypothetical protein